MLIAFLTQWQAARCFFKLIFSATACEIKNPFFYLRLCPTVLRNNYFSADLIYSYRRESYVANFFIDVSPSRLFSKTGGVDVRVGHGGMGGPAGPDQMRLQIGQRNQVYGERATSCVLIDTFNVWFLFSRPCACFIFEESLSLIDRLHSSFCQLAQ